MKITLTIGIICSTCLLFGCASGTTSGAAIRTSLGLPATATDTDIAQAAIGKAQAANNSVPSPLTLPIDAALVLASTIVGVFAHKAGVNSGASAAAQNSGSTVAPPVPPAPNQAQGTSSKFG